MKRVASIPMFIIIILAAASAAMAQTITAANCSESAVQGAITSAPAGWTVLVPAGNCTWSPNVTVADKALTIQGAGVGQTVIAGGGVNLRKSASRITGFTFNLGGSTVNVEGSVGFRLDHNTITSPSAGSPFCLQIVGSLNGTRSNTPSEGLIDNNNFTNCRIVVFGEYFDTGGSDRWADPLDLGTGRAVYVEDNTAQVTNCVQGSTGVLCNFVDANVGGRYVARFNTIVNAYFEMHGAGEFTRAARLAEIYHNATILQTGSINPLAGYFAPLNQRGGFSLMFHNTFTPDHPDPAIGIGYERSADPQGSWGTCNGAQFVDGNELPNGYLCRDQTGASTDSVYWGSPWTNPSSVQAKAPAYLWRNTQPNGEIVVQTDSPHTLQNRDWYKYNAAFNGTTGVGEGLLASRPATCTPGVAYWATDEGEWNSRQAGPDGQLYRCVAADTWQVYYVPFAYPHPLQAGGGPPPPPDTTAPTVAIATPTTGSTYSTGSSPLTLGGTAADNVGVTEVAWANDRGGSGTATGTASWTIAGIALQSGTNILTVTARDAAGNLGTDILTVAYAMGDITPPTAPGNVMAALRVTITWTAAADNVRVTGYRVYRDGVLLAVKLASARSHVDNPAPPGATYTVTAVDAAGNESPPGGPVP